MSHTPPGHCQIRETLLDLLARYEAGDSATPGTPAGGLAYGARLSDRRRDLDSRLAAHPIGVGSCPGCGGNRDLRPMNPFEE